MGRDDRPLIATYRLQLHAGFDFDRAAAVLPYLAALGVSHVYLSPILAAARGSTHGYDVIDHERLSTVLGGERGFARLVASAHAQGLGLVVDIVPNHMSTGDPENRWWWDVLENGPASLWAQAFDIDWQAPEDRYRGAVLVPVLGDHRSKLVARREIKLVRDGAQFVVVYADRRFPVAPRALGGLLAGAARASGSERLAFLGDALRELPRATTLDRASLDRRRRDLTVLRALIAESLDDAATRESVDRAIAAIDASPDALDAFLDEQNYCLVYWRAARHDLDYRRFFDIDSLVGLRMENDQVLEATHALVTRLVTDGSVDGLRVDHVDGLASPRAYLEALRHRAPRAYVFVEKILGPDEELRNWPVDGTTGYELMADLTALSVEPDAEGWLAALDERWTGETRSFEEIASEARLEVLDRVLPSDVHRLSRMLADLRERHRDVRDHSSHDLEEALRALLAVFPVYRTYVEPERGVVEPEDVLLVQRAIMEAKERRPALEPELFDFIGDLLLLHRRGVQESAFVRRFQQLTPSTMAKGVEDTAFYRAARFLAANEVGGSPERFTLDVERFHARNVRAARRWPERLVALSTHDSKRSADVRARLVAVTAEPERYAALTARFFERCERHRVGDMPEPRMLSVALQTLVGAWPLARERFVQALEKSAKEAKEHTSWIDPRPPYEAALHAFAERVIRDEEIRAEVEAFVSAIEPRARAISLAWTLLACTIPGAPDVYQGTEVWSYSLVDPDNRRPVSFDTLEATLASTARLPPLADDALGMTKQRVLQQALALRHERPELFGRGASYEPFPVSGRQRDHALAFLRRAPDGGEALVVVAHRPLARDGRWEDTSVTLPSGRFRSRLDDARRRDGEVMLDELFRDLPVALLVREASR
jgi:(1->4)-alpha-D-glucan 1-alpha-D-glucosylmutase